MKAHAVVHAGIAGIERLRSDPPLVWRPTGPALYLVGGAAGPLGGDELGIEIRVARHAALSIRSTAAQIVLPDHADRSSLCSYDVVVASGGALSVQPEPTVLTARARHRAETLIRLEQGACLWWREVLVLGRHGEPSGVASARLRVELDGSPLVHHELSLHPAALRGARVVGMAVAVDPAWAAGAPPSLRRGTTAWTLPASGPAACTLALAAEADEVLAALDRQIANHGFRAEAWERRVDH